MTSSEEALDRAMTVVWEERLKHSVLSEAFYALTKVWERLLEERRKNV